MKTITEIELMIKDLLKEVESLKKQEPKFEVGKWYKSSYNNGYAIVNAQEKCQDGKCEYYGYGTGYDIQKSWAERIHIYSTAIPATPQEVENALIAEAKKRGFKEGVSIKGIYGGAGYTLSNTSANIMNGDVFYLGGYLIYSRGQWAEIIKDDKIIIGGYEVEFFENEVVKIGCKEFRGLELTQLRDLMIRNGFNNVKFSGCNDGYVVFLDTIKKIINKIKD